ncbi:glutamate synthase [NADH], partial [Blastocladiella emersonii ATCC 22665]
FVSDGSGNVAGVNTVKVAWRKDDAASGKWVMEQVAGTHATYKADVVLLAMGFVGPEAELLTQLGVATSPATRAVAADTASYATSVRGVFAAGDCRRGQSLVVWGIREGREAARQIDEYVRGDGRVSALPTTGGMSARAYSLDAVRLPAVAAGGGVATAAV